MEAHLEGLEQTLAEALASLKPFLLKRSWISTLKKDSEISVGGYGIVHRGILQKGFFASKTNIAVKKLYTTGERTKLVTTALELVRELTVHATLNHPNVLPLLGFYLNLSLDEAWIVSPLASNGNLFDYLERVNPGMEHRLELAKETAMGLEYLHTRIPPICHGDIKTLNVLVGPDTRAMLCDFGLSKEAEEGTPNMGTNRGGTIRYWGPELFIPDSYPTLESDVWAWGCVLLEIVTGLIPYNDIPLECRVIHQITENVPPAGLDTLECPIHIRDLLAECWQIIPDKRPGMQRVLASLTTGNLQFFIMSSSQLSMRRAAPKLDALERELIQVLHPLQNLRINPSRLKFPKLHAAIGVGGHGTVYRALYRVARLREPIPVAVKKLRVAGGRDKCLRMAISLVRELTVWASLFHENIIPLIGFHLNDGLDQAWLVSPYMANGSILDYIKRIRANEDLRILLALDTAKGLHYLHNINPPVCHGDIKALNVLITDEPRAVLCDFGLAKTMEEMPSGLTTSTFNQAGSLPYESPELVHGTSQRSRETDVWAWGCLLQEIFTERCPYYWANNPGAIIGWIAKDIPPATLSEIACPGYVRTLLSYCWQRRPFARPTMDQCLSVLRTPMQAYSIFQELEGRLVNGSGMGILRRADIIFDEKDKIGSGSFGITYRAQLVDGVTAARTKVVVKKLFVPSDPLVFQKLQTDIRVAVEQQLSFTHPNVLKLIGYYSPSPNPSQEVLLVSSQLLGRSLIDYLKSRNYSQKLALANDICQGLIYLHTRSPPTYHGNLHPGNIIVGLDGRAVLSDCPLADLAPYDHAGGNTPATEIKRYQSPERLANTAIRGVYDDTWSWGCVFLEIVTGRVPYQDIQGSADVVDAVSRKTLPAPIDDLECPVRSQNILGLCWKWEPQSRATIGEIESILSGRLCRFGEVWSAMANKGVHCLKFSDDGVYLIMGLRDCIRIYETESGRLFCTIPLSERVFCIQMSHSRNWLAASTLTDHRILLWKVETLELVATYQGHREFISAIDISPDDTTLVSGSDDYTIRVWRINGENNQPLAIYNTAERLICLTLRDSFPAMAVSYWGTGVQIVDVRNGSVITKRLDWDGTPSATLRFSPDLRHLYGTCFMGTIRRWELEDLLQPPGAPRCPKQTIGYSRGLAGSWRAAQALSISPPWVTLVSDRGDVRIINTKSGSSTKPTQVQRLSYGPHFRHVDLSPISEEGVGFVVACPDRGGADVTVYRYEMWDYPGVYKLRDRSLPLQ